MTYELTSLIKVESEMRPACRFESDAIGPAHRVRIQPCLAANLAVRSRIPRVSLVPPLLAPGVERVVHHHAVLEHLVVVLEVP